MLEIEPDFIRSLRNLTEIYVEIEQKDEAKKLLENAISRHPESKEFIDLYEKLFS